MINRQIVEGQTIYGRRIIVSPDRTRTLPDEVIPGVPWPVGFKEEIDAWMASFFKPQNMIPDGTSYVSANAIQMNPRTYEHLREYLGNTAANFTTK